jgi:hypothetical protein
MLSIKWRQKSIKRRIIKIRQLELITGRIIQKFSSNINPVQSASNANEAITVAFSEIEKEILNC